MGYFEIIEVQYYFASTDSNRPVYNFRMIERSKSTVMDVSRCQHDFCLEQLGHQKGAEKRHWAAYY